MDTMTGKLCLVTGGNTGIGKATVRGLARLGATVLLASRDRARGEAARAEIGGAVEVLDLDLASLASVRRAAAEVRARGRLDVLVCNAGVWTRRRSTTRDGFELTFGVNHLGHFLLVQELVDLLRASAPSRVVVVSSNEHYRGEMVWGDLMFERRAYRGPTAYRQSKLANLLFTAALARRLEGSGVIANALHPGVVTTELAREYPRAIMKLVDLFLVSPEEGARTSLHLASAPVAVSGRYFVRCREKRPSARALDQADQERLWRLSEQLISG
jgi:NAD(P)-dependent dehydrogenase (short-subunit alcohol dehydrogenase family)